MNTTRRLTTGSLLANSTKTCYSVNSHEPVIDKVWTEVSHEVPKTASGAIISIKRNKDVSDCCKRRKRVLLKYSIQSVTNGYWRMT